MKSEIELLNEILRELKNIRAMLEKKCFKRQKLYFDSKTGKWETID